MKKYEIQTRVTSWAYIEIEAENEEEALKLANVKPWEEWKHDTDWSSADTCEVRELEEGYYL